MNCECCGQPIIFRRSLSISDRFHAHITWLTQRLGEAGIGPYPRERVYFEVLLRALDVVVDGGEPYPYVIVPRQIRSPITGELVLHDLPEPMRTGNRTNRQMMTACFALDLIAAEMGYVLPERPPGVAPRRKQ